MKNEEIQSSLVSNEQDESLLEKAGGVNSKRDTWSLWVEKCSSGNESSVSAGVPRVDPVRKENFNPPRDFKIARVHG